MPLLIREQLGKRMSKVRHHSVMYESYIEILYLLNGLFLNHKSNKDIEFQIFTYD